MTLNISCHCFVITDLTFTGTILPYPSMAGTLTVEILLVLLLAFIESVRLFFGKQISIDDQCEEGGGGQSSTIHNYATHFPLPFSSVHHIGQNLKTLLFMYELCTIC